MKEKRSLKKLGMLGFIVPMFLSIMSCSSSRIAKQSEVDEQGWKTIKADKTEEAAWIIYRRNKKGGNFYEYKIEGLVEASPERCIASYKQDIYDRSNGIKKVGDYKYSTYNIVSETSDAVYIYAIHNEPFPLKDTEMNLKFIFDSGIKGNTGVKWHEAWDEFPVVPSRKLNRVETFRGSWRFTSTDDKLYKASNTVQFVLKGQPIWFAQPMVNKF